MIVIVMKLNQEAMELLVQSHHIINEEVVTDSDSEYDSRKNFMKKKLAAVKRRTSRLTIEPEYIPALGFLSGVVPKHILHKYLQKMSKKSKVVVLDVLMKNETEHKDMLEIMKVMQ